MLSFRSRFPAEAADLMSQQQWLDRRVGFFTVACIMLENLRWFRMGGSKGAGELVGWALVLAAVWALPPCLYARHRTALVFAMTAGCGMLPHHRDAQVLYERWRQPRDLGWYWQQETFKHILIGSRMATATWITLFWPMPLHVQPLLQPALLAIFRNAGDVGRCESPFMQSINCHAIHRVLEWLAAPLLALPAMGPATALVLADESARCQVTLLWASISASWLSVWLLVACSLPITRIVPKSPALAGIDEGIRVLFGRGGHGGRLSGLLQVWAALVLSWVLAVVIVASSVGWKTV